MKNRKKLERLYDQITTLQAILAEKGDEALELLKPTEGELIEAEMEFSDYTQSERMQELGPDWTFLSVMDQREAEKEAKEEERKLRKRKKGRK